MNINILIVDDEKSIRETLKIIFKNLSYNVFTAQSGPDALSIIKSNVIDILITDLRMPVMDGIELMNKALEIDSCIETIFISAYADIKAVVQAVKLGAFDYIEKSFSTDELVFTIEKAIELKKLKEENRNLRRQIEGKYNYDGVIAKSEGMQKVINLVDRVANSKANVLLTGESGVGKDVIAYYTHKNSNRSNNSFIVVNCGAIPENLIESELFGHEKGSFTGADRTSKGKFELADNGTVFLDEIGELPLHAQVKFLRVLQEKQICRIGSENSIGIDVRIIAATNKSLSEEVEKGNFREDLYYRLNVINIDIPPLRERKDDILVLTEYFLQMYANEYDKKTKYFDMEAVTYLLNYAWKGNVRELKNVIERSILLSNDEEFIKKKHLPQEITGLDKEYIEEAKENEKTLEDYEKIIIENTLKRFRGNKTKTAEVLGIKRQTLYNKLKGYNLDY